MPCLHEYAFDEQFHRDVSRDGIITAERLLYLRIPVSACTAEIRALNSAGGCCIRRIWYNDRRAVIIPAPNRQRLLHLKSFSE